MNQSTEGRMGQPTDLWIGAWADGCFGVESSWVVELANGFNERLGLSGWRVAWSLGCWMGSLIRGLRRESVASSENLPPRAYLRARAYHLEPTAAREPTASNKSRSGFGIAARAYRLEPTAARGPAASSLPPRESLPPGVSSGRGFILHV